MSKSRWSVDDFKKAGLIQIDGGNFVKASSRVATKVDKIKLPPDFVSVKNINAIYPNGRVEPVCIPPDFKGCYTVVFKPMSVNEAWKGKRYRSDKYNAYKLAVGCLLPKHVIIPDGLLKVYYEFGLSSNGGDWDNPVKPLQDILQEAYQFNDSRIMEAYIKKVIVPKGSEYIRFKIESLC